MKNNITTMLTTTQSSRVADLCSVAAVRLRIDAIIRAISGPAPWSPPTC